MIELINESEFKDLAKADWDYYQHRWSYISKVIDILNIQSIPFNSCIELGCHLFSISKNGDTIDINPECKTTYCFDANKCPWDIEDKKYDLFIGLQVLEHLDNHVEVFKEIKRISKYAIISLPYKWSSLKYNCHNNIDENVIYRWAQQHPSASTIIPSINLNKERIINFYRFD